MCMFQTWESGEYQHSPRPSQLQACGEMRDITGNKYPHLCWYDDDNDMGTIRVNASLQIWRANREDKGDEIYIIPKRRGKIKTWRLGRGLSPTNHFSLACVHLGCRTGCPTWGGKWDSRSGTVKKRGIHKHINLFYRRPNIDTPVLCTKWRPLLPSAKRCCKHSWRQGPSWFLKLATNPLSFPCNVFVQVEEIYRLKQHINTINLCGFCGKSCTPSRPAHKIGNMGRASKHRRPTIESPFRHVLVVVKTVEGNWTPGTICVGEPTIF